MVVDDVDFVLEEVLAVAQLPGGARDGLRRRGRHQQIERDIAQGATSGAGGVGRVGAGDGHALVSLDEGGAELAADAGAQRAACVENGIRIDIAADLARDVAVARRHQRERDEGWFQLVVAENGGQRRD